MAFDYLNSRATAENLLANFGQTATLTQTANSGTAYSPTQTETDHACTVVILDWKQSDIDGTLVLRGDKKAYISTQGLTVTPSKDDRLTVGGEAHEIVDLMPLSPAGTVVMWEAQIRS